MEKLRFLAWPVMVHLLAFGAVFAQRRSGDDEAAAAGCAMCGAGMGAIILIPLVIFALNIALLVWVARDAKARGLDSSILWMLLVFFTSFIGLIIYILSRPQGELVQCPHCGNRRLRSSAKCPTCGNP
jgi:uncharacterized membrane protein YhaH (DUF805 family)